MRQARRAISAVRRAIWPRRRGPIVLNYHRVANLSNDPWSLAVSPIHFEEHLRILKSVGRCLTVDQLVQSLHGKGPPFPCFVITFDDGYRDNFTNALPLLQKYEISATMFLVSGMLNSTEEFWWDTVDRAFLTPGPRPLGLSLAVSGRRDWYLGAAAEYPESAYETNAGWRATDEPPTVRHKIFLEVWETLYGAATDERSRLIQDILQWAELDRTARPDYAVMTVEEALQLGSNDLIEIGAHTVTHSPLTEISFEARQQELTGSKRQLETLFGRRIKSFAYPHSKFDAETANLVAQCGFDAACTGEPYNVGPNTNPRMLPRVGVGDWDGDVFARFLKQHIVS